MNTFDITRPVTAHALNENLFKQFNVRINFDKYTREDLENYRNLLRTKISQVESGANFNELLTNEDYQKDKYVLGVLNTRIKEMLGEAKLSEKKLTGAETKKKEKIVKSMKKNKGDFEKRYGKRGKEVMYATATKLAKKKAEESIEEVSAGLVKGHLAKSWDQQDSVNARLKAGERVSRKELQRAIRGEKNEPLSLAKLKGTAKVPAKSVEEEQISELSSNLVNRYMTKADKEALQHHNISKVVDPRSKKASDLKKKYKQRTTGLDIAGKKLAGLAKVPAKNVEEGTKMKKKSKAKPDFLDMDKDGNKKEPMKKAVADKKKAGLKKAAPKKKVKESRLLADSKVIIEAVVHYLREDEEGKAKAITSGVDMVNDFTSWMQRVANYQTKTMIELADSIRANFGVQESETFKASVGAALENALNSLTSAREEINNAVAVLAGEAPAAEPMGQEPDMDTDMGMSEPDELNVPGEDEFAASDAAAGGPETLGRMKRESIERGNRLMKILGS